MNEEKIVGIYLAAGKSSRFGDTNKLLARVHDKPLGGFALEAAIQSGLDKVAVIIKPGDPLKWITEEIRMAHKRWVKKECCRAEKGKAYSLRCGLKVAEQLGADAVIVLLADQPLITPTLINKLINQFNENKEVSFIGVTNEGIICPPLLLTAKLYPKIYRLDGDRGANKIICKEKKNGMFIENDHSSAFFDVDTKADYERLKQMMLNLKQ